MSFLPHWPAGVQAYDGTRHRRNCVGNSRRGADQRPGVVFSPGGNLVEHPRWHVTGDVGRTLRGRTGSPTGMRTPGWVGRLRAAINAQGNGADAACSRARHTRGIDSPRARHIDSSELPALRVLSEAFSPILRHANTCRRGVSNPRPVSRRPRWRAYPGAATGIRRLSASGHEAAPSALSTVDNQLPVSNTAASPTNSDLFALVESSSRCGWMLYFRLRFTTKSSRPSRSRSPAHST